MSVDGIPNELVHVLVNAMAGDSVLALIVMAAAEDFKECGLSVALQQELNKRRN